MNATWAGCAALGLALGCGSVTEQVDPDAGCDPMARFEVPEPLTNLDPALRPADASLSPDELTLYLTQNSPAGDRDLFIAVRSTRDEAFGAPVALTALNSSSGDAAAGISRDGRTLMFHSSRISGGGSHLYVAARDSEIASFTAAGLVAGVASPVMTDSDMQPSLTPDGAELWFASNRKGTLDIYRAPRAGSGFANPVEVAELSSPGADQHATLSADGLTVYFASDRASFGARGGFEIFRSRRAGASEPFSPPVLVEELNTTANDNPRWISRDNCRLYLHSDLGGTFNIYVAARTPLP
jgi:Tol biopolymer transport system component